MHKEWTQYFGIQQGLQQVKIALTITTALGVLFLFGQLKAWSQLVDEGVFFVGNPAGSFVYIFTGIHGLHLVSGVIYLIYMLISSFRYKVHSKNMLKKSVIGSGKNTI